MKRPVVLALGLSAVAILATFVLVAAGASRPRDITVTVEAAAGTMISGSYDVDGVVSKIETEAPTRFLVKGRRIEFAVRNDDQPGTMSVALAAGRSGQARTSIGAGGTAQCGYEQSGFLRISSKIWATVVAVGDDRGANRNH